MADNNLVSSNPLANQRGILRVQDRYSNPYEGYYANNIGNPRFDSDVFEKYYSAGKANEFIGIQNAIDLMPKDQYDALSSEYAFDLEQGEYRMAVLVNNLFADDTEVKTWTDPSVDEYGQEVTTTFTGTERAHNNNLYKQYADQLRRQKEMELKEQKKEEWRKNHKCLAFLADLGSVTENAFRPIVAAVDWIWDIASIPSSAINAGIESAKSGDNFFDEYVESAGYYESISPLTLWKENVMIPFDMNYTYAADVYGNYNWFASALNGLSESFGRMIPSMILSAMGIPGTHGLFYVGMTQEEIGQMANDQVFAETPGLEIITNAAARMAMEYAVERILDGIIGTSAIDRAAFGYYDAVIDSVKSITWKSAIKRSVKDALHEGLEEWVQEFSGYMINGMFGMFSEEFNENNKFDLQTQFDSFILGFLGSLGSTGLMMGFDRIKGGYKGGVRGFLADWEFKQVYSDMAKQVNDLKKMAKNGAIPYGKAAKIINSIFYTTQTLADYIDKIGARRSQRAIDLLNKISEWQSKKGFISEPTYASNIDEIVKQATKALIQIGVYHDVHFKKLKESKKEYKAQKKTESKTEKKSFIERLSSIFRKRNVTEISKVISKEEATSSTERDRLYRLIGDVMEETGATSAIITTDGNGSEKVEGVVVVPEKELRNRPANSIAMEVAQREVADRIVSSSRFQRVSEKLQEIYKKVHKLGNVKRGLTPEQTENMVLSLMFDKDFQKICLAEGSKEMYELISVLDQFLSEETVQEKHGEDYGYDDKMREQVEKAVTGLRSVLKEFIINQQYATYEHLTIFGDKDKRDIYSKRYSKDLSNRIVFGGKVTEQEYNSLDRRINSIPMTAKEKESIKAGIRSKVLLERYAALSRLDNFYKGMFFSSYDGKTYLSPITTANQVMNVYLEKKGMTVTKLLAAMNAKSVDELVRTEYGRYINEAYLTNSNLSIKEAIMKDIELFTNSSITVRETSDGELLVTLNEVLSDYDRLNEENVARVRLDRYTEVLAKDSKSVMDSIVADNSPLYDINEVVFDTSVELSEPIKSRIEKDYSGKDNWNTRLYAIRDFLTDTSAKTVVFMRDGTLAISDLVDSYEMLSNKNITAKSVKDGDKLTKFIKPVYLQGLGKDVVIKLGGNEAYFDGVNTIYLPTKVSDKVFRANLVHETQHVIQQIQGMNGGLDAEWTTFYGNTTINQRAIRGIYEDIKKINPELVKGAEPTIEGMASVIQDLVYFASGEASAYGLAGKYQHFIPFIIETAPNGMTITTPLGNQYSLIASKKQSSKILTDEDITVEDFYKELSKDLEVSEYLKLTKNNGKVLDMHQYEKYLDEYEDSSDTFEIADALNDAFVNAWPHGYIFMDVAGKNKNYKDFLSRYISSDTKETFQKIFAASVGIGPNDLESFRNVNIPFVRIVSYEQNDLSYPINSVIAGINQERLNLLVRQSMYQNRRYYLQSGTFVLDQLLYCLNDQNGIVPGECLVSSEVFKNGVDVYEFNPSHDGEMFKINYLGKLVNINESSIRSSIPIIGVTEYKGNERINVTEENYKNFLNNLSNYRQTYELEDTTVRESGLYGLPLSSFGVTEEYIVAQKLRSGRLDIKANRSITDRQIITVYNIAKINKLNSIRFRFGTGEVFEFDIIDSTTPDSILRALQSSINFNPNKMSSKKIKDEEPKVHYITEEEEKAAKKEQYKKKYGEKARRRYISNRDARGTNLEGYIKKGRQIRMAPEVAQFIREADPVQIEEELYDKIWGKEKGTLRTKKQITQFLKDRIMDKESTKPINDYTLRLIAKHIYGSKVNSFDEVQSFVDVASEFYILSSNLWDKENEISYVPDGTYPLDIMIDYTLELNASEKYASRRKRMELHWNHVKQQNKDGSYGWRELNISDNDLKLSFIMYFDGTIKSAIKAAAVARNIAIDNHQLDIKTVQEGHTSTSKTGKTYETSFEDIADENSASDFDAILENTTREDMEEFIRNTLYDEFIPKWEQEGRSDEYIDRNLENMETNLSKMSYKAVVNEYWKLLKRVALAQKKAMTEKEAETEIQNAETEKLPAGLRTNTVTNIKSMGTRIGHLIPDTDVKRFLLENGDIFGDDMKLKRESYEGKSQEELDKLKDRLQKIRLKARAHAFQSIRMSKEWDIRERKLQRAGDKLVKAEEKLAKSEAKRKKLTTSIPNTGLNKRTTKTYSFKGASVTIDAESDMPPVIQKIMETNLTQTYKTDITGLSEPDEQHAVMSRREFIAYNIETLGSMSEDDIRESIEFFKNSNPQWDGPDDEVVRRYEAFAIYTLSYMVGLTDGTVQIPADLKQEAEELLKKIVSGAGTRLAAWSAVVKAMRSEEAEAEVFRENSRKLSDMEVSESQAIELIRAVRKHDMDEVEDVMQKIYKDLTRKYKLHKRSMFDKLIKVQRAAMLSSPGTMIRNQVSNAVVTAGNAASDVIGKVFTFGSKKFSRFEKGSFVQGVLTDQYVLTGTKVSDDVKMFIQTQFKDSGLLALIQDGMNHYDARKMKRQSNESTVADLIIESIRSKVFSDNQFNTDTKVGEITNKLVQLVMKGLSDGPWVNRKALSYFGKMIMEEEARTGTDLHTFATNKTYEMLANAYVLASFDYMHKTNFWNKIEDTVRVTMGPAAYFVYKQLFPFASASWNWAVEGLKYSPIGLARAIINTFRLEQIADKLEVKRQHGEVVPSSRFTEFLVKRDIGKGIIGSILWSLGATLAALGLIRLDDEDDKLKLVFQDNVYIDVTSIFGSSSLLAGAALVGQKYIEDYTFWDSFKLALNATFDDWAFTDMYNSFRYDDSIADWLLSQPANAISKFVPNIIKNIATMANTRKVQYNSDSFVSSFERLVVSSIPGLAYAFPAKVDPYTGEIKSKYKLSWLWDIVGMSGIKIRPYDVSIVEQEALANGVQKGPLTGRYSDLEKLGVTLSKKDIEALNKIYGTLNKKELELLINSKKKYRVKLDDGTYAELYYRNMTTEQKKSAITSIMNDNASTAKIYIATRKGLKYYTSSEERNELLKLGIKNLYVQTNNKKGFYQ